MAEAPAGQGGNPSGACRAGRFRGMILEKLSGRTVAAVLSSRRSGVQDVHYIRDMLTQARVLAVAPGGSACRA